MSDGLPATSDFASRVTTYSAGSQVRSADLNELQDRCIAISESADQARLAMMVGRLGSGNLSDSPTPDSYGGRIVWCYKVTTGTTVVVLDSNLDWRDRWVEMSIKYFTAGTLPGDAGDDALDGAATYAVEFFYSQQGQSGSSAQPGALLTFPSGGGENLRIYARNTDGALCMKRASATAPDEIVLLRATCSPQLNQY